MTEDKLHESVAQFLTFAIAPPGMMSGGVTWFSFEPRAKRSIAEGGANKRRGCIAGVPDITVISNGKPIFIELKTADSYVSRPQKALHRVLWETGAAVFVCRSVFSVAESLKNVGVPLRATVAA